jgi:hypothetical protein
MADHVDVIKQLATPEVVLGRVWLAHGRIEIESQDNEYWRQWLSEVTGMDPDAQPEEFLHSLAGRLEGSYVFATEPHDEHDCPYAGLAIAAHPRGAEHVTRA